MAGGGVIKTGNWPFLPEFVMNIQNFCVKIEKYVVVTTKAMQFLTTFMQKLPYSPA